MRLFLTTPHSPPIYMTDDKTHETVLDNPVWGYHGRYKEAAQEKPAERYKQEHLIEQFVTVTAAQFVGVHHKTVAYYFHGLREIIAYKLEKEKKESEELLAGETWCAGCIWLPLCKDQSIWAFCGWHKPQQWDWDLLEIWAKRHLRRFNGILRAHFGLFLKECEWRFNCRDLKRQIRQLKQWVRKIIA